jgi:hypothetical protein
MLDAIKLTFADAPEAKGQQMKLCASCIAPTVEGETAVNDEAQFAAGLIDICASKAPDEPKPVIQVLDRGAVDKEFGTEGGMASHMEFGINGDGVIFGDKLEIKVSNKTYYDRMVDPSDNMTMNLAVVEAQIKTFAFTQDAPQKTVDAQWKEGKSHTVTTADGMETRQKTADIAQAEAAAENEGSTKTPLTMTGLGEDTGVTTAAPPAGQFNAPTNENKGLGKGNS